MWLAVHLKSLIINSTFMFPVVQPWPDLPISFLATLTVCQRLAPSSTRTVDACPGIGILLHQGPVQMQVAWRLLMRHTTDSAYRKHHLSSYTKIPVWWSIALVSNSTTITQIITISCDLYFAKQKNTCTQLARWARAPSISHHPPGWIVSLEYHSLSDSTFASTKGCPKSTKGCRKVSFNDFESFFNGEWRAMAWDISKLSNLWKHLGKYKMFMEKVSLASCGITHNLDLGAWKNSNLLSQDSILSGLLWWLAEVMHRLG